VFHASVALNAFNRRYRIVMRTGASGIYALAVVHRGRAVQADANAEAQLRTQIHPGIVQQHSIGLHGEGGGTARRHLTAESFYCVTKPALTGERRLASVKDDEGLGLAKLGAVAGNSARCGIDHIAAHDRRLMLE